MLPFYAHAFKGRGGPVRERGLLGPQLKGTMMDQTGARWGQKGLEILSDAALMGG